MHGYNTTPEVGLFFGTQIRRLVSFVKELIPCEIVLIQAEAREANGEAVGGLDTYDLEVLLDLLKSSTLGERTRAVLERAIVRGLISEINVRFYFSSVSVSTCFLLQ